VSGAQVFSAVGVGHEHTSAHQSTGFRLTLLRVPCAETCGGLSSHGAPLPAAWMHRVATANFVVSFVLLFVLSPARCAGGRWWGCTLADRAGINPAGPDSASPDPHGCFEIAIFDSDTTYYVVATASKCYRTASTGALMAALGRPLQRWSSACPPLPADHPMRTVLA
jgi:hypothetical protein